MEAAAAEAASKKAVAKKRVQRKAQSATDSVQAQLKVQRVAAPSTACQRKFDDLKRKLVQRATIKSVSITPGLFSPPSGKRRLRTSPAKCFQGHVEKAFKPINFDALGRPPAGGCTR